MLLPLSHLLYMKQNADGKTVAAADMLVPGIGELIGGSQREEDYGKLVARMDELGMDMKIFPILTGCSNKNTA